MKEDTDRKSNFSLIKVLADQDLAAEEDMEVAADQEADHLHQEVEAEEEKSQEAEN